MENNKHIAKLFEKYLNQQITDAELDEILIYFDLIEHEDFLIDLIQDELNKNTDFDKELVQSIGENIAKNLFVQTKPKRNFYIKRYIPYVAAAILICVSGIFLFQSLNNENSSQELVQSEDIQPGKNRATISLSNGQVLTLKEDQGSLINRDNELIYGDGSNVLSLDKNQDVIISTPRSGQYSITLSDGTRVWLNAASQLTYPIHFDKSERKVSVVGEAYFEVSHDPKRPFLVNTGSEQISVLGTSFNVHAYPNSNHFSRHITLLDGSVEVKDLTSKVNHRLKPGQQALNQMSKGIKVINVDANDFIAWKDGVIVLHGYELGEIILQLERWYDVDFDELPESIREDRLYGVLRRDVPLNDVLNTIKDNYKFIEFKIQGRRVMMSSK